MASLKSHSNAITPIVQSARGGKFIDSEQYITPDAMTDTANEEDYGDYGAEESQDAVSIHDSDSDRSSD